MASYDTEHDTSTTAGTSTAPTQTRRPDFTSFFAHLSAQTDTSSTINPNAVPLPSDLSAAYRLVAEGFESMRQHTENEDTDALDEMISSLLGSALNPPDEIKGVDQEYIDSLERVPKKMLRKDMDCPICGCAFLDDEYPLVVKLPCQNKIEEANGKSKGEKHGRRKSETSGHSRRKSETKGRRESTSKKDVVHAFDLECVAPWLRVNGTCPLDRVDLRPQRKKDMREWVEDEGEDESDGEWDDMYA